MIDTGALGISDVLRRSARERPAQVAVIDGSQRLTYAELDECVTRAALALGAAGARPGDRVTLTLATGAPFVQLYLGGLRAGLVVVPVNPAYAPAEVERIRNDCGAVLHITSDTAADLLDNAPAGADPHADRSGEATSVLLYTSGTSGLPKGAMLSARALLANLDQLAAVEPPLLTADDVLLIPLPLTHVFGLNAGLGMALRVGATVVLVDRFEPGATLRLMQDERVTAVLGVPGQYAAWLRHPDAARGFAGVRFAMSGAAGLPPDVVAGFAALDVVVHDGYGLTEAAPVVTLDVLGAHPDHPKPGSIGRPLPGTEVQLRDVDGEPLDPDDDDPGRIYVRGPNLFSGYWPLGEDGPDEDGWFGTGDIAVRDEDGDLHLVGRASDLVIVNGFNVYPAEVEAVLAALPGVAEVAVVGVPDPHTGEAVRAFVVPRSGAVLDAGALSQAAARSLARFKLPKAIEVVAELPHSVTGKVLKWRLSNPADGSGSHAAH